MLHLQALNNYQSYGGRIKSLFCCQANREGQLFKKKKKKKDSLCVISFGRMSISLNQTNNRKIKTANPAMIHSFDLELLSKIWLGFGVQSKSLCGVLLAAQCKGAQSR